MRIRWSGAETRNQGARGRRGGLRHLSISTKPYNGLAGFRLRRRRRLFARNGGRFPKQSATYSVSVDGVAHDTVLSSSGRGPGAPVQKNMVKAPAAAASGSASTPRPEGISQRVLPGAGSISSLDPQRDVSRVDWDDAS